MLTSSELLIVIISYGLGCFSTGYYLVRLRTGQDIRKLNSGSTGGRNVGRVLGKWGFALTMAGDTVKGVSAAWIASRAGFTSEKMVFVLIAVVVGHIFPIQLGFHGGRGLSPILGSLLIYDLRLVLVAGILILIVGSLTRQFTLSLMAVITIGPLIAIGLGHTLIEAAGLGVIALLLLITQRANIRAALDKLRNHEETAI
jgi:glycerol-3-phosphate acyltransferase PlsY